MIGKRVNISFPSSKQRSKVVLYLVHSDVYEPISVASIIGNMYYVSSIDVFSRKTWIYFLKTKDEVFIKFHKLNLYLKTI